MLKQKIIGTEYKKIKYHGEVKHLLFECNNCHKQFSKMESYCRKQVKIHKNACCFCSPNCRNQYFKKLGNSKKTVVKSSPVRTKTTPVIGWLKKIFS